MSGGYYDYASSVYDLHDIMAKYPDFIDLCESLKAEAPDSVAASHAGSMLALIRVMNNLVNDRINKLQPVLHAFEWWKSCDYSEKQFRDSLTEYAKAVTE